MSKLLVRRFGELPVWTQERLSQANTEQLESWSEQICDAKSLDDLLEQKGS